MPKSQHIISHWNFQPSTKHVLILAKALPLACVAALCRFTIISVIKRLNRKNNVNCLSLASKTSNPLRSKVLVELVGVSLFSRRSDLISIFFVRELECGKGKGNHIIRTLKWYNWTSFVGFGWQDFHHIRKSSQPPLVHHDEKDQKSLSANHPSSQCMQKIR